MHLAQRREDGRSQRRGLRRAVQVPVGLAVPARQRRVDLRAGCRETNRRGTPVRPRRRLQHARGGVHALGQLQRGDREGAAHHRRHVDAARHVPLERAPRVARRRVVGRGRVIQVRRPVTCGHHVNDVLRRRVVGGTLDGFQASGLLGVVRHPVLPRVDVVGAVRHRNAVLGGPHEAARDVFGVEVAAVARRHINRGDAQRRVHAVHAHAVMLGGNRPGHVRAVCRVVPAPRRRILVGDAVDVAGHGLGVIHLPGQVRHGIVDGLIHDAHGHGGTHDVDVLGLERVQGLEVPPVGGLRVGSHPGLVLALGSFAPGSVALGTLALHGVGLRRGREHCVGSHAGRVVDGDHGLVAADGCLAGGADGVVADAFLDERRAQVG